MHLPETRWQASFYHLLFSLLIFLVLLALIVYVWYPGIFIDMGGWRGIRIAAGVDFVLGPLLTLMVYNKAKSSIKWDMAVVFLMQFSALGAGVWLIYNERPMLQVLSIDAVFINTVSELKEHGVELSELEDLGSVYPLSVYVNLPNELEAAVNEEVQSLIHKGVTLHYRVDKFSLISPEAKGELDWRFDTKYGGYDEEKQCQWLPIMAAHFEGYGCLHFSKGLVALKPISKDEADQESA